MDLFFAGFVALPVGVMIVGLVALFWLRRIGQPIWGELALGVAFSVGSLFKGQLVPALYAFLLFAGLAAIAHAAVSLLVRWIKRRRATRQGGYVVG